MENLLVLLSNSTFYINGCLRNCSNHGTCPFNAQTQTFMCICDGYYTGLACQIDTRPCSQNGLCLHKGICLSPEVTNNFINDSFECKCKENFKGSNCENLLDVCLNEKCSSHGHCYVNDNNQMGCKCYSDYTGEKCESTGTLVKIIKYTQASSLVVFLSVISVFSILIIANDVANIFCSKRKNKPKRTVVTIRIKQFKYFN